MKKIFVGSISVALVSIVLWSYTREAPVAPKIDPQSANEDAILSKLKSDKPNGNISTHADTLPDLKSSRIESGKSSKGSPTETPGGPIDPEEEKFYARTAQEVKLILESKKNLDPEAEFAKASVFDMSDVKNGMFSGVFLDNRERFYISILSDGEGALSEFACAQTSDDKQYSPPDLSIRYAGDGIALAKIGSNYYLRMGLEFQTYRILIGKLYRKSAGRWVLMSEIEAKESSSRKLPDHCVFNP